MASERLRAIIFDFDGVIVESLEIKTEAFRSLFSDHPEQVDRIVQLHLDNPGVSRYEKFRVIYEDYLGRDLDDAETDRLDRRLSQLVYERVVSCSFVPGALEFLSHASRSHSLYLASATPEDELRRIVDARGLSSLFAAVRGSPAEKCEIVGEILAGADLRPDQAVMVGDAVSDYRAAADNGVPFIGRVPDGAPSPFDHLDVLTVRDLDDLQDRWDAIVAGLSGNIRS